MEIKINLGNKLNSFLMDKKSKKIKKDNLYNRMLLLHKEKNFRNVLIIFLLLKILIIGIATASLLIPPEFTNQKLHLDDKFLNLFAQYDSHAYLDIAENGYNKEFGGGIGNYSYFPLFPLLVKLFAFIFGFGWAGFIVSNLLSILAVYLLYIILKDDFNSIIAKKSLIYFLLFPVAYFFTMMYTESLFFVLILLMFYYARRDRWLLVGIFGMLASMTRMFGIIMALPMLYIYLNNRKFKIVDHNVLWLGLIPLGLLIFFGYLFFTTGDFFISFKTFAQPVYSFRPLIPGLSFIYGFIEILKTTNPEIIFYILFNLVLGLFFTFASFYSYKIKKEYFYFMLPYLFLTIGHTTLNANVRYYMLMFPAYVLLAKIKNKNANKLIFIIFMFFLLLMILFTIRHVNTEVDFIDLTKYVIEKII